MAKTVYIIPGCFEKTGQPVYVQISDYFRKKRYFVKPVNIDWKNKTMSDYVLQFKSIVKKDKGKNISVFGFSYGAMIAFISASDLKPKKLYLCSLSPYFKEDLKYIPVKWKKIVGKRRIKDLNTFSFDKIACGIKSKTYVFVGDKEGNLSIRRAKLANKKIKNSKLIIVLAAKHDISDKNYLSKIKENIF